MANSVNPDQPAQMGPADQGLPCLIRHILPTIYDKYGNILSVVY